jgi:hypothetical protein
LEDGFRPTSPHHTSVGLSTPPAACDCGCRDALSVTVNSRLPVPSWFLRITCDRCGKDSMLNEAHMSEQRRDMELRVLIARMRHDGCGGAAGRAELLTGIDGVSSQPVRMNVLLAS